MHPTHQVQFPKFEDMVHWKRFSSNVGIKHVCTNANMYVVYLITSIRQVNTDILNIIVCDESNL